MPKTLSRGSRFWLYAFLAAVLIGPAALFFQQERRITSLARPAFDLQAHRGGRGRMRDAGCAGLGRRHLHDGDARALGGGDGDGLEGGRLLHLADLRHRGVARGLARRLDAEDRNDGHHGGT